MDILAEHHKSLKTYQSLLRIDIITKFFNDHPMPQIEYVYVLVVYLYVYWPSIIYASTVPCVASCIYTFVLHNWDVFTYLLSSICTIVDMIVYVIYCVMCSGWWVVYGIRVFMMLVNVYITWYCDVYVQHSGSMRSVFTEANYLWANAIMNSRSIWWNGKRHLVPMLDFINCADGVPSLTSDYVPLSVHSTVLDSTEM